MQDPEYDKAVNNAIRRELGQAENSWTKHPLQEEFSGQSFERKQDNGYYGFIYHKELDKLYYNRKGVLLEKAASEEAA